MGKIYEVDGKEVTEYLPISPPVYLGKSSSRKQSYLYGERCLENIAPFSKEEFIAYLNKPKNIEICRIMCATGDILNYIGASTKREQFKSELAEFIIMELIISKISSGDIDAKRAYMYYRDMIEKEIKEKE